MESKNKRNVNKVATKPKSGRRGARGSRNVRKNARISYGAMFNQVRSDVQPVMKLVKYLLNSENKYLDTVASTAVSTTAYLNLLNPLAEGDTASTRTGDMVKFDLLQFNLTVTINASATASVGRCCIVRDEQPNGGAFGIGSYFSSVNNPLSLTNFQQETRFYTYLDEVICVDSQGPQVLSFRKTINLGFHTNYGLGNAGTIADISKNSLYVLFLSNEATNTPTFSYTVRLLYLDN